MIRLFPDPETLSRMAAQEIATILEAAVISNGRARVVLSGGETPRRTYELLASGPARNRVTWDKVEFFFGDERPVPPEHPDSNFRMANEAIFEKLAIRSENVHRIKGEVADRESAAREYEAEIARSTGVGVGTGPPSFDLVLLGLGPDGHTASLFPGTKALEERARWVVANPVPSLGLTRLTMTPPLLCAAENVIFLVAGKNKAGILEKVLEGPSDPARFPAQKIRTRSGQPLWFLDRSAAEFLPTDQSEQKAPGAAE